MATAKLQITADELFIQAALKDGRASIQDVSLKAIGKPDTRFQARVLHLNMDHVHRLSALHDQFGQLAPVVIFRQGNRLILADGFHRHEVHRVKRLPSILAYVIDVPKGESIDRAALEFATMCNREMCLGRTKEDIKKAIWMLLEDEAWFNKSASVIGAHVGVVGTTVRKYRLEFCQATGQKEPETVFGDTGKPWKLRHTANTRNGISERPYHDGKAFYATVHGKRVYLGTNPKTAEDRFSAIRQQVPVTVKSLAAPLDVKRIEQLLVSRGIFCNRPNNRGNGLGEAIYSDRFLAMPLSDTSSDSLVATVGRLILNKIKTEVKGRMVLLCLEQPAHEASDLARQLGIEFMTPEEFVASLKGDD